PRSPRGERPEKLTCDLVVGRISIHAPREGSDYMGHFDGFQPLDISIHAPREGSDLGIHSPSTVFEISIHAPREGSDIGRPLLRKEYIIFLSTLPARGATSAPVRTGPPCCY